ncbi:Nitroreductase [Aspergillus homomorphus CBS 101889]|uniref:Nitroreductase n=1 Tax=Aspergillus homomorphus (strain CBS 101889) TaxID=1450537 RepID=A0A395ID85_ASPHC|nr:Nitroreductase [Aspergillus homomorphus CBS 101889]RAL16124.1 Nitroreductase [Aspergillus homomorphus CBS 101889]
MVKPRHLLRRYCCTPAVRITLPRSATTLTPTPALRFSFSSSSSSLATPKALSAQSLPTLAQNRRTIYKLGRNHAIPDSQIEELVQQAILHVPSAFNTQSTRLVVLLHREHERLWDLAIGVFQDLVKTGAVPEPVWKNQTLPKLEGFKAAVGTVLFYEDPAHIEPMAEKFALFKDRFEPWAQHSNAMHQYFLWTGLEALGFGANLQHYNPLIDAPVAEAWNVPKEWKLSAQLVFGSPEAAPGPKEQKPVDERVKIYGKL